MFSSPSCPLWTPKKFDWLAGNWYWPNWQYCCAIIFAWPPHEFVRTVWSTFCATCEVATLPLLWLLTKAALLRWSTTLCMYSFCANYRRWEESLLASVNRRLRSVHSLLRFVEGNCSASFVAAPSCTSCVDFETKSWSGARSGTTRSPIRSCAAGTGISSPWTPSRAPPIGRWCKPYGTVSSSFDFHLKLRAYTCACMFVRDIWFFFEIISAPQNTAVDSTF